MFKPKKSDYIIVIPARYYSKRLPGKPLKLISGIPMIIRTCLQCLKVVKKSNLIVATDHKKIVKCCEKFKIRSILTSKKCKTGTDRVAEVAKKIKVRNYINVQGDEPLFNSLDLRKMIITARLNRKKILLGYTAIKNKRDYFNKNVPKVVFDNKENLLYASRAPIPLTFNSKSSKAWRQVLVYSFPRSKLIKFSSVKKKTKFENFEDVEILRFLELGEKIKLVKMSSKSHPVDTIKDLKYVRKILKNDETYKNIF